MTRPAPSQEHVCDFCVMRFPLVSPVPGVSRYQFGMLVCKVCGKQQENFR